MNRRILVLGGTGTLGLPVSQSLVQAGHQVRVLARDGEKASQMLGAEIEVVEGDARNKQDIRNALTECDAVHISLPLQSELAAMKQVIEVGERTGLERITYISATTVCEANRWYELVDVKMRAERLLKASGIPSVIFCPTWAMETLHNFIRGKKAVLIVGKKPPPLHFVAAMDLGRMVAASYNDDRAIGKRLFVHGPEGMTLAEALERFVRICYPERRIMRMRLWQAQGMARVFRRKELAEAVKLIAYFDKVGELGDPTEANQLFGAPTTTLEEWCRTQKSDVEG